MSFSADWLALRRDADNRARNGDLTAALATALPGRRTLRVLDLGCGTGANMHALSPHLDGRQTWVLADNDAALLERIEPPAGVVIHRRQVDIAADLDGLFSPAPDLVTASAFFDLCGTDLADRIVARTVGARAAFHTVLTYDGREIWEPPDPLDAQVLARFVDDQRRDKGLGPALGPAAVSYLARAFGDAGYGVSVAASDWDLHAPDDAAMIAELANGHAATARRNSAGLADRWLSARLAATRVVIGHQDLLALPRG